MYKAKTTYIRLTPLRSLLTRQSLTVHCSDSLHDFDTVLRSVRYRRTSSTYSIVSTTRIGHWADTVPYVYCRPPWTLWIYAIASSTLRGRHLFFIYVMLKGLGTPTAHFNMCWPRVWVDSSEPPAAECLRLPRYGFPAFIRSVLKQLCLLLRCWLRWNRWNQSK